jgi:hypothetical protein
MGKVVELFDQVERFCAVVTQEIAKSFPCRLLSLPEKAGVRMYRVDASASGVVLLLMTFERTETGKWAAAFTIINPALVTPTIGHDVIALAKELPLIERVECKLVA